MQFLKFSFLLLSLNTLAFTGTECFENSFEVSVTHKSFPFGLLSKTISIEKKNCELTVTHNEWKYLNNKWVVDICRDPIHIKNDVGSMDVLRKVTPCTSSKSDFCNEYTKIKRKVEDDGLIFASGEKSDLASDHGKVFCSYILMNEYLNKSVVFNKGHNYDYLLKSTMKVIPSEEGFNVEPNSSPSDF